MSDFKYKVLITTSGTGSRLQHITKNKNKALVEINDQPAIYYVLKAYPKEITLVITLGYLGNQVKEFLLREFTDRKFEFVWVDNYDGPGSSLGYSLLCAKDNLQCPFVFHACDTIVIDKVPKPDRNWIAGYVTDWSKSDLLLDQYRTHSIKDNKIISLNDKGAGPFDSIHIGLDGVYDYKKFWDILEHLYKSNPNDSSLSEVHVLDRMLKDGTSFEWIPFSIWLDTGNINALQNTEKYLKNN